MNPSRDGELRTSDSPHDVAFFATRYQEALLAGTGEVRIYWSKDHKRVRFVPPQ